MLTKEFPQKVKFERTLDVQLIALILHLIFFSAVHFYVSSAIFPDISFLFFHYWDRSKQQNSLYSIDQENVLFQTDIKRQIVFCRIRIRSYWFRSCNMFTDNIHLIYIEGVVHVMGVKTIMIIRILIRYWFALFWYPYCFLVVKICILEVWYEKNLIHVNL